MSTESQRTTPSQENYIEWIFRLSQQGSVSSSQLADKLGVKRSSVTKAIDALTKKGLVAHKPFGCIELTSDGVSLGRAMVRRDECLTELLVKILGMTPEEADPEVHRLEHVLSDSVLARLEVLVDFASLSDAWIKRLHHRINCSMNDSQQSNSFQAGCYIIHQGDPNEKAS
ncbi:metal-dependent transcriptional regulator [bacterium]|nr:metal-dependent transcriptional regulator [bacterium]